MQWYYDHNPWRQLSPNYTSLAVMGRLHWFSFRLPGAALCCENNDRKALPGHLSNKQHTLSSLHLCSGRIYFNKIRDTLSGIYIHKNLILLIILLTSTCDIEISCQKLLAIAFFSVSCFLPFLFYNSHI